MAFVTRDVIPPYRSSIARVTVSQDELWRALWTRVISFGVTINSIRDGMGCVQHLTLPNPNNPSERIGGPLATVWPREGNHQASQDGLRTGRPSGRNRGGRILARVDIADDYAPLKFRRGINCVAIQNLAFAQACDNSRPRASDNHQTARRGSFAQTGRSRRSVFATRRTRMSTAGVRKIMNRGRCGCPRMMVCGFRVRDSVVVMRWSD